MAVTPSFNDRQTHKVITWTGETGTSAGVDVGPFADCTIQASGTGTVTVQGSNFNEADNLWVNLTDVVTGGAITLSAVANAMATVVEHPERIRITVSSGTANVVLVATGNR